MIDTSGVRRSCDSDDSNVERSRSRSGATCAASMSETSVVRSIAAAACSASVSSRRVCSGDGRLVLLRHLHAEHADRPAGGAHRQEQPVGDGQCRRAEPRRLAVRPRPLGRRRRSVVEAVFRRIASGDVEPVVSRLRHQHQRLAVDGGRHVVHHRPEDVVQRRRRRALAAEVVEVGRCAGRSPAMLRPARAPGSQDY